MENPPPQPLPFTNHPTQHKNAAFHSTVNRLLNIPLNQIVNIKGKPGKVK
jgi:hypothetical protein